MKIKQKWLNAILHISSVIYHKKSQTLSTGILQSILLFIQILFFEIMLGFISLPFYIFIVPDKTFDKNDKQVKMYHLRRKITIGTLLIFLIYYGGQFLLGAWGLLGNPRTGKASLTVSMTISGTYTGNGGASQSITGLGFQPDMVIIDGSSSSNTSTIIATSSMPAGSAKNIDTNFNTFGTNYIQSLDSNGFTVANDVNVNTNGATYYWTAFKGVSGTMKVGSYTGNGTNGKTVTGLGFSPDYVIFMGGNSSSWTVEASSAMPVGMAYAFAGDNGSTGRVNSLDTDGFTLGTSSSTNSSGTTYYYAAWKEVSGRMDVGSYTGDGIDNRNITGIGFQPDFITIKGNNYSNGVWRNSSMVGDLSLDIPSQGNSTSDVVQSLQTNGFQIGTSGRVNSSTTGQNTYYYAAFLRSVPPTFTQSAYRFYQNADSLSVGSALAAANTAATLSGTGDSFRLRMLMHVASDQLVQNGETFKLQYVDKGSGTCASPSGSSPATYTDVTGSTLIAYKDNTSISDGTSISGAGSDPTHSSDTVTPETYEEANNFTNSRSAIAAGADGEWDFSLYDHGAAENNAYCFRMVRSDSSTVLDSYSVYPQITTALADHTAPTITGVNSSTTNGSYPTSSSISIQVAFDEVIYVVGTPQLTLETGTTDAVANYASGSGTNTLTFTYIVGGGENSSDLDYASINALTLSDATIRDASNNDATLTLPVPGQDNSLSANKALVIDTTAPTVLDINSSTADGMYHIGGIVSIQILFNEAVTVTGTPTLTLETGSSDAVASYSSGSGTNTLTFTYTVSAGENSADLDYVNTSSLALAGGSIKDASANDATLTLFTPGQAGSLSANKNIVINTDVTAPTISRVTSGKANGTYGTGEAIPVVVEWDEAVSVTGIPQIIMETGATDQVATYTSGSGTTSLTFTYTVADGDSSSDLDYTSENALSLAGGTIKDIADNSATLTLPTPGGGSSLANNKDIVIDTTPPDTTAPTVMNVTSSTANGSYNVGDSISIQLEMSEVVNVSGGPRLLLETGASDTYATYVSGSGSTTLTFSYTIGADQNNPDLDYVGSDSLDLNGGTIEDVAHNSLDTNLPSPGDTSSLSDNKSIAVDTALPTISGVTSPQSDGTYGVGEILLIRVQFSETVFVSGTPQLELETGATDTQIDYTSGSGSDTLTFSYTIADGQNSPDLDYTGTTALILNGGTINDAATNDATLTLASPGASGSLGNSKSFVVDTAEPVVSNVTSSTADGTYKTDDVIDIQIVFSEPVTVTGVPQLQLETGSSDGVADYSSGSGTSTLNFSYTVSSGHTSNDLDYTGATALTLNGGTIQDSTANDATLTLAPPGDTYSLAANKNIVIDAIAPASSIINLSAPTASTITVNWTASGDNANSGTAASYDLRYSTSVINSGNFDSATNAGFNDTPQAAGQSEQAVVSGLSPDTTYYFALKTVDEAGNISGISNTPSTSTISGITPPPSPEPESPSPPPPTPTPSSSSQNRTRERVGPGGGGAGGASRPTSTPPPTFKSTPPSSDQPGNSGADQYFVDITSHWAKDYIKDLKDKCNVSGFVSINYPGEYEFQPDHLITRGEFTTLLIKCSAEMVTLKPTKQLFSDLPVNHWAAPYVQTAVDKGIISLTNKKFRPNDPLTLAEALKMILLIRFDKKSVENEKGSAECKDVKAKDWFAPYLGYAVKSGIITRYKTTGKCEPLSFITRAEVAKILMLNTSANQRVF